jgi:hypothetical protein
LRWESRSKDGPRCIIPMYAIRKMDVRDTRAFSTGLWRSGAFVHAFRWVVTAVPCRGSSGRWVRTGRQAKQLVLELGTLSVYHPWREGAPGNLTEDLDAYARRSRFLALYPSAVVPMDVSLPSSARP